MYCIYLRKSRADADLERLVSALKIAIKSHLPNCINVSLYFVQIYKLKKLLQKRLTYSYKYDII